MKIFVLAAATLFIGTAAYACEDGHHEATNKTHIEHTAAKMAAPEKQPATPNCMTAKIEGMTCEACATTVKANLEKLPGVNTVDINVEKGTAAIHTAPGHELSQKSIRETIERSDYVFKSASNGC